ncbi:hypothetical protein P7K49_013502 [Saguinus oedipus]|uniref:Uncharacterized protein n=1 Tax=Saguinus oedipus TaxID=9490 RepID=A0ABQ9VJ25_SAGOE|nr:hypothetical protein P7K49_013502 [Saguinus oedipus]
MPITSYFPIFINPERKELLNESVGPFMPFLPPNAHQVVLNRFILGLHFKDLVCFVNLDVNKDECSTEHLQQVTLETQAIQELITRTIQLDFICK